jgi:uncharacterized protein (TIGR04255 family)
MGELLKSQPLIEALCEFYFNVSGGNQLTLPGLFYAEVRDDFPIQESVNELALQIGIGGGQEMQQLIQQTPRLLLKGSDNSAMLQIAPNRLIINQLKPYINWGAFKSLILDAFRKYINVSGDFELSRISLRYINHIIPAPNKEFNIEDFLTIIPLFPKPLEKPIFAFQQSYEFMYDSVGEFLVHKTGVAVNTDGINVLVLDLDYISQKIENLQDNSRTIEWLSEWLDKAHNHIESAFLSSLNPIYYESIK